MGSLSHITILDLTRLVPGPYTTMFFADLGARVIKIEEPAHGDHARDILPGVYEEFNRNKESVTLNLKADGAKDIFLKLVENADVVIESFRPGVTNRLGIDYEACSQVNPKIIYCSISGFGQSGPYSQLVGHDINYRSVAGSLFWDNSIKSETAYQTAIPVGDFGCASVAAMSISVALALREQSGEGQYLDVSIAEVMTSWMGRFFSEAWLKEKNSKSINVINRGAYGIYETSCGSIVSFGCVEDVFWEKFLACIDDSSLLKVEHFSTFSNRVKNNEELDHILRIEFKKRTKKEWLEIGHQKDIPISIFNDIWSVLEDPQLQHRNMFVEKQWNDQDMTKRYIRSPVLFSNCENSIRTKAPTLGQNTYTVLQEMGFAEGEIKELKNLKVI